MGKYDHLSKLEVQALLRRVETIPQKFQSQIIQELRDRLAQIEEEQRASEIARDERKHSEVVSAARRSKTASFLSVVAAHCVSRSSRCVGLLCCVRALWTWVTARCRISVSCSNGDRAAIGHAVTDRYT